MALPYPTINISLLLCGEADKTVEYVLNIQASFKLINPANNFRLARRAALPPKERGVFCSVFCLGLDHPCDICHCCPDLFEELLFFALGSVIVLLELFNPPIVPVLP